MEQLQQDLARADEFVKKLIEGEKLTRGEPAHPHYAGENRKQRRERERRERKETKRAKAAA